MRGVTYVSFGPMAPTLFGYRYGASERIEQVGQFTAVRQSLRVGDETRVLSQLRFQGVQSLCSKQLVGR